MRLLGLSTALPNDMDKASSGVGFPALLTIVFITLKLLGKIDWSWWWVLSPMWISGILWLGCVIIYLSLKRRNNRQPSCKL